MKNFVAYHGGKDSGTNRTIWSYLVAIPIGVSDPYSGVSIVLNFISAKPAFFVF